MDKLGTLNRDDIQKLKTRISYLENENRWYFSALELVASMGEMHRYVPKSTTPQQIFEKTNHYLKQLIKFKSVGFFQVSETDKSFKLVNGEPEEDINQLRLELDYQIEKGAFAWALKQNRALIVESKYFQEKLLLHILSTKNKVKGMVIARLEKNTRHIPSEVSTLLTIVMHHTAYALENGSLYNLLNDQNKSLEKKVQKRTVELENTTEELKTHIQELKDFAYTASHDLQEPLRKVITFGERLQTKFQNLLDPKAKEYIKVMSKATNHMQKLIDALLQLTRISTKSCEFESIPIEKVVNEALLDLESKIARSKAKVYIEELPILCVDKVQMRQLFTQLINNAITFSKPDSIPEISISSHPVDKEKWEISVSDNGIGFNEKFKNRIFKPFERLHGRSEREGTGMGLAICDKIMERHGGTITAKSTQGKGSTFTMTLGNKSVE